MAASINDAATQLGGVPWGVWVQTTIFFLGAVGTFIAIRMNSKDSRRRATIDLVMHQRSDAALINAKKQVSALAKKPNGLSQFNKIDHPDNYQLILDVLNHYEFIAAGIHEKALDEDTYKRTFCSMLVRDWKVMSGLVHELRTEKNLETLFQEFERLAKRWEKTPLKK